MRRRLILIVVVPAVALAACGSSDNGGAVASGRGESAESFCRKATAVDRQFDDLDGAAGTGGVPKREALTKAATSLDALAANAPIAVRGDLRTVASDVRKIADLLGEVDISDQKALTDPANAPTLKQMSADVDRLGKQVQAATDRVAKYLHDECGIDTGTTTTNPTKTTTTTPAAVSTTMG